MAQFTDLPNEIAAQIAQNVYPSDIVNFSSTSKFIHSVCQPSLKVHREMERKYKQCTFTGTGSPLADLLSDIILRPTAALYVEYLDIQTLWNRRYELLDHPGRLYHPKYPQETMSRFTQVVADSIPSDQVSRWTAALESGDEDPVLALLLLRLPAITTLTLTIGFTLQCLFQTMELRLAAPEFPFLPALTTLNLDGKINYSENQEWQTWQAISYFAMLPSLRSMTIQNFSAGWAGQGVGDSAYLLQPQSSNVTSISIKHCRIPEQPQYQFLQCFKALRRLSYEGSGIRQKPVWTHSALSAHCKASLEYLDLSISWTNHHVRCYMGSLVEFQNLKELHTRRSHLLDDWYSASQVLAKVLPASIEKVHLYEAVYATPKNIQKPILDATKDKHKYLPNLQELRISFRRRARDLDLEQKAAIVHMQAKCKEAGFKLTFD